MDGACSPADSFQRQHATTTQHDVMFRTRIRISTASSVAVNAVSGVPNTGLANTNNILTLLLTHTSGQLKYAPSSASAHIDERIVEDRPQTGMDRIALRDCTSR